MAADSRTDNLQVFGFKRVAVRGRFLFNGTSNPPANQNKGKRWTVVRSGVGTYTITFTDKFAGIEDIHLTVTNVFGNWTGCVAGSFTVSNRTLIVKVFTISGGVAVPVDIAIDGESGLNFLVVFKNTTT